MGKILLQDQTIALGVYSEKNVFELTVYDLYAFSPCKLN